MNNISRIALVFIIIIATACSSERDSFTNRTFHNLTSHYNAYYLADVKIKNVESQVKSNYKEDYSQILPVFIPIDSTTIKDAVDTLQSARDLASKAVEWHKISKWVDDSYYLLGKIDYLQAHFDDAQNTYKFVNVNSKDKDLRHKTLISLLRLYVDLKEFENANFTIDYLSKESGISDQNRYELYRTLAYYYETRSDENGVIGALVKALDYAEDKKEESRINFILAQRYQREGLDALAYDFYQAALAGNPPYERSFFSLLYAQQVAELNASKDLRKVRNYYEDLYNDPKNEDLKDVVVYEMALFEEKQGDIEKTLRLLHQAAKEPGSNPRQKGYIYQKLAEISLKEFKDYRATKYYLDSALSNIKKGDPIAEEINLQKEPLDQYVFHLERIQSNDSLISLSKLSPEEQSQIAENFIKSEEKRLLAEAAAKQEPESSSIFDNLLAFSDRGSGSTFYFDNSVAMQQGTIDFYRTWGNRPIQDNWRRSSASFQSIEPTIQEPVEVDSTEVEESSTTLDHLPDLESLLAKIPNSEQELSELNHELEESYFELGKLLYFDLNEIEAGISNLETLVREYPNSIRKPEAYYLLYLSQKEREGNYQQYIGRLNSEFPGSQYTYSVNNPDATSGNLAYLASSRNYEIAYKAYYNGEYQEARSILLSTLEEYPLTRNTERILLLDIMITGKLESRFKYRQRLESFIQNSKDENLIELARNMLRPMMSGEELASLSKTDSTALDSADLKNPNLTENEGNDSLPESPYKVNNSGTHIFVLAMSPEEMEEADGILGDLETFHKTKFQNARLRTGNMKMNSDHSIFIISPFNNADLAKEYYQLFLSDFKSNKITDEIKNNSFVISIENFQQLNKSKNLDEYRTFFKSVYK